ncbi:hypothetical protein HMPREF1431_01319 [Helicobacter pylori GAMchJs106B]|nr:hypothetical protein HMPREF1431_01319 [Helicobacter pylori GAMchJs106B]
MSLSARHVLIKPVCGGIAIKINTRIKKHSSYPTSQRELSQ